MTVVSILSAPDKKGRLKTGACEVTHGFGAFDAGPHFVRHSTVDALMDAMGIIPFSKTIQIKLNTIMVGDTQGAGNALPEFQSSKQALHLAVKFRMTCRAAHHVNAEVQPENKFGEGFSELAAVVGDDETRRAK